MTSNHVLKHHLIDLKAKVLIEMNFEIQNLKKGMKVYLEDMIISPRSNFTYNCHKIEYHYDAKEFENYNKELFDSVSEEYNNIGKIVDYKYSTEQNIGIFKITSINGILLNENDFDIKLNEILIDVKNHANLCSSLFREGEELVSEIRLSFKNNGYLRWVIEEIDKLPIHKKKCESLKQLNILEEKVEDALAKSLESLVYATLDEAVYHTHKLRDLKSYNGLNIKLKNILDKLKEKNDILKKKKRWLENTKPEVNKRRVSESASLPYDNIGFDEYRMAQRQIMDMRMSRFQSLT